MRKRFGIIGYPLAHTLSPKMHNRAFKILGIDAIYEVYPFEHVEEAVRFIRTFPLEGASVTMPHKESILRWLDELDEEARSIGAVNTVLNRNGKLYGSNTDAEGLLLALKECVEPKGMKVLILGAGGAAKAACYALKEEGAEVFVSSRTYRRALALVKRFEVRALKWEERDLWEGEILINATPLGSEGEMPISPAALRQGMVVMDMVYTPRETPLLREAKRRGAKTIEGLRMLLFQGVKQLQIWLGITPPLEAIWEAITKT